MHKVLELTGILAETKIIDYNEDTISYFMGSKIIHANETRNHHSWYMFVFKSMGGTCVVVGLTVATTYSYRYGYVLLPLWLLAAAKRI